MKLFIGVVLVLAIVACCQGHTLKKRSLDQLLGGGLGNLFGGGSGGGFNIGSLLQGKLGGGNNGAQRSWSSNGSGSHGGSHDHVDKVIYVKIIEEKSHGNGGWNSGW